MADLCCVFLVRCESLCEVLNTLLQMSSGNNSQLFYSSHGFEDVFFPFLRRYYLLLPQGQFEILSLSGYFLLSESGAERSRTGGLSVLLAGPDGHVLGGGVAGVLTAASAVQVLHDFNSIFLSYLTFCL